MAMLACAATANGVFCDHGKPRLQSSTCMSPLRKLGRRKSTVRVRAEGTTPTTVINPSIRKEEAKVVDNVAVAELSKPLTAYCRCWRSGTFPLCDGTHAKHNKETGDNVGPLLVKK